MTLLVHRAVLGRLIALEDVRVRVLGDPVLRKVAAPVGFPPDEEARQTAARLKAALAGCRRTLGFGRGIAAPQVGSSLRMIYTDTGDQRLLINPRVLHASEEAFELWDDCLSLPDLLVWVRRSKRVVLEYFDLSGTVKKWTVVDAEAELLQHEMDHLDGFLMIDRATGRNAVYARSEYERQKEENPDLGTVGPNR